MSHSKLRTCALVGAFLLALPSSPVSAQSYDLGLKAYEEGQYQHALDIWQPLAEDGHPVAQYSLGKLFEEGRGPVSRDSLEAAKWYRMAADQGIAAAANNLGLMYSQGAGVPRDLGKAAELWLSAAERGHPMAQYNIGLAYFNGDGVGADREAAAQWFRRAAESGVPEAQFVVGQLHRQGIVVEEDSQRALSWYRMAAAQGHRGAAEQAGLLEEELGVAQTETPGEAPQMAESQESGEASSETEMASQTQLAELDGKGLPPEEAAETAAAEDGAEDTVMARPGTDPETVAAATQTEDEVEMPASSSVREMAPAESGEAKAQVAAVPSGSAEPMSGETMSAASGIRLWLGSASSETGATEMLETTSNEYASVLNDLDPGITRVDLGGDSGVLFRLTAGPLQSREDGEAVCQSIRDIQPSAFCKVQTN